MERLSKEADNLRIFCVYCNAEWDAEMKEELESFNAGCETCGYGAGCEITVTIYCSNCGRKVYEKLCKFEH